MIALAQLAVAAKLTLTLPTGTTAWNVPLYDTLYNVRAVARDTRGYTVSNASVTCSTRPGGIIANTALVIPVAGTQNKTMHLYGNIRGSVWLKCTWLRSDGGRPTDSVKVATTIPRVFTVTNCLRVRRLGAGFACDTAITVSIDAPKFCNYVIDRDRRGNILTGRRVATVSSNPFVVRVDIDPTCPDTSIDPMRVAR